MLNGNIFDYIDWRGDITFDQSPLNEVDALILSLLSYTDFSGIVPEGMEESIRLEEAVEKYFQTRNVEKEKQARSMMRNAPEIAEKLAESARFKDLKLINHVSLLNIEKQEQFSAVSVIIDKKTIFVSYRGTDDNIVGWKEDFNMSFLEEIPSQKDALEYLNKTAQIWRGKIYLGGHSKGGNLAVYAAINAAYSIKRRILRVFNNDGPGFSEKVINSEKYNAMSERILNIVPQSSVIGMLFNHGDNITVVYSSEPVQLQHDATTWQLIGNHFVYMDGLSDLGMMLDKMMSGWLDSQDEETRMKSIDAIFGVIEKAGVKSLTDLNGGNVKAVHSILRSYGSLDAETKKLLGNVLKELIKTAKAVTKQELSIKEKIFGSDSKQ